MKGDACIIFGPPSGSSWRGFRSDLRDKWTLGPIAADWALIVLKDPVSSRPVAVKALTPKN